MRTDVGEHKTVEHDDHTSVSFVVNNTHYIALHFVAIVLSFSEKRLK